MEPIRCSISFLKFLKITSSQILAPTEDGVARIRDIFSFIFDQWEEVEMCRPSLITVYGVSRETKCSIYLCEFNTVLYCKGKNWPESLFYIQQPRDFLLLCVFITCHVSLWSLSVL